MAGLDLFINNSLRSYLFTSLVASMVVTAACNSNSNNRTGDGGSLPSEKTAHEPKPEFKDNKIAAAYNHYLHVKNALIQSDSKDAQLGSSALKAALLHAGDSEGAAIAAKIASTADLKAQRAEFDALTNKLEPLLKKAPLVGGKIYKQYCPMANEGNGGFWFSSESSIKNPYYGDEMLDCGEVKEVIQ